MRILIANDDGVGAPGLGLLADTARVLSSDVWIVAPERKWTAASHQLTFDRDQTLTRVGERIYACSGAPADCVVAAMSILFAGATQPDLVLAGINDKSNVGEDLARLRSHLAFGLSESPAELAGHAGAIAGTEARLQTSLDAVAGTLDPVSRERWAALRPRIEELRRIYVEAASAIRTGQAARASALLLLEARRMTIAGPTSFRETRGLVTSTWSSSGPRSWERRSLRIAVLVAQRERSRST